MARQLCGPDAALVCDSTSSVGSFHSSGSVGMQPGAVNQAEYRRQVGSPPLSPGSMALVSVTLLLL